MHINVNIFFCEILGTEAGKVGANHHSYEVENMRSRFWLIYPPER